MRSMIRSMTTSHMAGQQFVIRERLCTLRAFECVRMISFQVNVQQIETLEGVETNVTFAQIVPDVFLDVLL